MATKTLTTVGLTLCLLGTVLACTQILGDVCVDDGKRYCEGAGRVSASARPASESVDGGQASVDSGVQGCSDADASAKCPSATPVCWNNTCVQCAADGDCPSATPVCSNNACVQCVADGDCPSATPACSSNACLQCVADSHCPAEAPLCSSNACVACLENQCDAQGTFVECRGGQKLPPVSCGDAFDCTTDSCATSGCQHIPDDAACRDTNACNGSETCNPAGGNPTTGCQPGPALPSGTPCGNAFACNAAGACIPVGCTSNAECAGPTDCAGAQTCNVTSFQCEGGAPTNEGVRCDPAGDATVGVCTRGLCSAVGCIVDADCGGATPECVGGRCVQCDFAAPRCSAAGGRETCVSNALSVDDCGGNGCTGAGVCNTCSANSCSASGDFVACLGGQPQPPIACADTKECTADTCTLQGCAFPNRSGSCGRIGFCVDGTCIGF